MNISDNPTYQAYMQARLDEMAAQIAPKISVLLGTKSVEDLLLQFDKVCEMFEVSLMAALIEDWRKSGWKI